MLYTLLEWMALKLMKNNVVMMHRWHSMMMMTRFLQAMISTAEICYDAVVWGMFVAYCWSSSWKYAPLDIIILSLWALRVVHKGGPEEELREFVVRRLNVNYQTQYVTNGTSGCYLSYHIRVRPTDRPKQIILCIISSIFICLNKNINR